MNPSGLHLALTRLNWSYFCTLTFGTGWRVMSVRRMNLLLFKWLRVMASIHGIAWDDWLWCVRGELGEKNGRFHLHALLGYCGTPLLSNCKTTRFRMLHMWESFGGGMARVRAYSDDLKGVGYILKGLDDCWQSSGDHSGLGRPRSLEGANQYELGKFDPRSCDVMVGRAAFRLLVRHSTNNRRLSARAFRARCKGNSLAKGAI